jgi:hypothetical protein
VDGKTECQRSALELDQMQSSQIGADTFFRTRTRSETSLWRPPDNTMSHSATLSALHSEERQPAVESERASHGFL